MFQQIKNKLNLVTVGYFFLPILFFILSSVKPLNSLLYFVIALLCAALLLLKFLPKRTPQLAILLWAVFTCVVVSVTGWFHSPFFFALYLLGVGLSFIYPFRVSVVYTLSLIFIFLFSGDVEGSFDIMLLLSLLSVIPISLALRRDFLKVQQDQKDILVLETGDDKNNSALENLLQNSVNRVGVNLRQPVTYLKQGLAELEEENLSPKEAATMLKKMRDTVEEIFTIIREFEHGVTKNLFLAKKDKGTKTK
ncbi:MAG: hypothetical protein Q7S57_04295 [bacterium]|nr:hypothetical protein [bacterium]